MITKPNLDYRAERPLISDFDHEDEPPQTRTEAVARVIIVLNAVVATVFNTLRFSFLKIFITLLISLCLSAL